MRLAVCKTICIWRTCKWPYLQSTPDFYTRVLAIDGTCISYLYVTFTLCTKKSSPLYLQVSLCVLTDDKHPEVDFHCSPCFPGSVNFFLLRKIMEYFGLFSFFGPQVLIFFLAIKHTETLNFWMLTGPREGLGLCTWEVGQNCTPSSGEQHRWTWYSSVSNSSHTGTSSRVLAVWFFYISLKKQHNFLTGNHSGVESNCPVHIINYELNEI